MAPLTAAAQLQPNLPAVHCNLGSALAQSARSQEAVASFEQAIRLNPEYIEAFANLAEAQDQLHRRPEAIAAARTALELARRQGNTALVQQLTGRWSELREDAKPATPLPAPALPPIP